MYILTISGASPLCLGCHGCVEPALTCTLVLTECALAGGFARAGAKVLLIGLPGVIQTSARKQLPCHQSSRFTLLNLAKCDAYTDDERSTFFCCNMFSHHLLLNVTNVSEQSLCQMHCHYALLHSVFLFTCTLASWGAAFWSWI